MSDASSSPDRRRPGWRVALALHRLGKAGVALGEWAGRPLTFREVSRRRPSVLVHDRTLLGIAPRSLVLRCLGSPKDLPGGRPAELTVLVVHNRPGPTLLEESLARHGVTDPLVVRLPPFRRWVNTLKITEGLRALLEHPAPTPYLLYADADDCVLSRDLAEAVGLLEESGREVLFSGTGTTRQYRAMPEVLEWVESRLPDDAGPAPYLNAGVFLGRWEAIVELFRAACEYVIPLEGEGAPKIVRRNPRGWVEETAPFPCGVESDQTLLRFLQPRFGPRIGVDLSGRLAWRRWG